MTSSNLHPNISIRITIAFLQFISSVLQSSTGVDKEKLDHLKENIRTIFKISESNEATIPNVSLYNLFEEADEQNGTTSEASNAARMPPLFSIGYGTRIGLSLAFLFHEFHMTMTEIGFFDSSVGKDYLKRKSCAKQIFKDAIEVLRRAGYQTFNSKNLVEGLKLLGNNAMQYACYGKAIVMYSCALALCKDNIALYFYYRAVAYTKIGKFNEAILDCCEVINLELKNVLEFCRLGYEQGNVADSIREVFIKVLQLDPHNDVHFQLADEKLKDELARMRKEIDNLTGNGVTRQSTVLVFGGAEEGDNEACEVPIVEEMEESSGDDRDTI